MSEVTTPFEPSLLAAVSQTRGAGCDERSQDGRFEDMRPDLRWPPCPRAICAGLDAMGMGYAEAAGRFYVYANVGQPWAWASADVVLANALGRGPG